MNNLPPKSPIWGTLEQVQPHMGGWRVVFWQSWRAAMRNPVEALRYEKIVVTINF
jgi:hypothetical protein